MRNISLFIIVFSNLALTVADEKPQLMGIGANQCRAYLLAFKGWEQGQAEQIGKYLQYREWFSGMGTGLSLATAQDVLHGVEIDGAMRRIQLYCDEKPDDDFFTASMDLIRILSTLR